MSDEPFLQQEYFMEILPTEIKYYILSFIPAYQLSPQILQDAIRKQPRWHFYHLLEFEARRTRMYHLYGASRARVVASSP